MSLMRRLKEWWWRRRYDAHVVVWPEEEVQVEVGEYTIKYHDHNLADWVTGVDDPPDVFVATRREAEVKYDADPCTDTMCYARWTEGEERVTRVLPVIQ